MVETRGRFEQDFKKGAVRLLRQTAQILREELAAAEQKEAERMRYPRG